jgi:hypothetical protein
MYGNTNLCNNYLASSPTFYDDASGKVTLHTHKLNAQLFSRIARFFVPCCKGRPEKVSIEKNNGSESTISCSHNNKSSDSVTVVDTNLIFPSGLQAGT